MCKVFIINVQYVPVTFIGDRNIGPLYKINPFLLNVVNCTSRRELLQTVTGGYQAYALPPGNEADVVSHRGPSKPGRHSHLLDT